MHPQRFALDWASAAEAPRFVNLITSFTKKIEEFGPLGQVEGKEKKELLLRLTAARSAVGAMKLRAGLGNLAKDFRKERDYNLQTVKDRINDKLGSTITTEVGGQEILIRLERQGPLSTAELSGIIGWQDKEVNDFLLKMGKKGQVSEEKGRWALN